MDNIKNPHQFIWDKNTVFVKSNEKETGSMSNDKEYEMGFLRFS